MRLTHTVDGQVLRVLTVTITDNDKQGVTVDADFARGSRGGTSHLRRITGYRIDRRRYSDDHWGRRVT